MGFLQSIKDEYDNDGNYIGNSPQGNKEHGVEAATGGRQLVCAACDSTRRKNHSAGGTVCGACGCSEAKWKYR